MDYSDIKLNSSELKVIKNAEIYARSIMREDDLHGIAHVERVIKNVLDIQKKEGGDIFILLIATWLHDIGRVTEKEEGINHAIISARLSVIFLKEQNFSFSEKQIERISLCIKNHSFSAGRNQNTLEEKILSDADKLDALGSVGIYRASAFQHEVGTGINGLILHFHEKLLNLHKLMKTKTGNLISEERTNQMRIYLENLLKEIIE